MLKLVVRPYLILSVSFVAMLALMPAPSSSAATPVPAKSASSAGGPVASSAGGPVASAGASVALVASDPLPAALRPLAAAAPSSAPGSFQALTPSRLLDTRTGLGASGPVGPSQSIAVQALGLRGLPRAGVAAVVLTVTVTSPTRPGYITVYADGSSRPDVSNLNFTIGQTVPNLVVVPVGSDGKLRLFNGSRGSVQLVGDVAGYYLTGTPTAAGAFQAVRPARLLDTRTGLGAVAGRAPLRGGSSMTLKVTGSRGIPNSGVSAVVMNVTANHPAKPGFVTAFANGAALSKVSSLNFQAGQTVPNLVVVPVGVEGKIRLYNGSLGSVELIGDVAGYFLGGVPSAAGALQAATPRRLLDTRRGLGAPDAAVRGGGTVSLKVAGVARLPNPGISALVLNVTAVDPTAQGYVTVYPSGRPKPTTSNLGFAAHETVANLVMVPIGADGRIRLYYSGAGRVDLLVDVVGFYLDGSGPERCIPVQPDPAGSNVTRWDPVVLCVLSVLLQSPGNLKDVETMIRYESSGNPNAINLWDSNAKAGHPSKGLMQVIQPTFNAYRTTQLPNDLYNPAANIYAGLHYAIARYGSIHNVPGLVSLRKGGPYVGYIVHQ